MKRILLATAVLSIVLGSTALAGDKHEKCTADTQTCLNRLAAKIQSKAWLGVELETMDSGWHKVTAVVADSPAEAAGFQAGDILVSLNGVALSRDNKEAMVKVKRGLHAGSSATYVVKRAGGKQQLAVTLGHVPALVMAEWIGQHMIENHAEVVVAAK